MQGGAMNAKFFLLLLFASITAFAATWTLMTPSSAPTELHSAEIAVKDAQGHEISFADCGEARAAGKAPLMAGHPGYRHELDPDGTGIACMP